MRMSSARSVQSGGSVSSTASKSSAKATAEEPTDPVRRIEAVIATTEYERLREAVGLVDRSSRGKFLLTGRDVAEFLQGQLTNDVEALTPGTGCYAALLDHKGKIRADMRVLRGADWIWLDTEPGFQELLARTVATFGIGRDVKAEDATADHAILSLVGPGARSALDA